MPLRGRLSALCLLALAYGVANAGKPQIVFPDGVALDIVRAEKANGTPLRLVSATRSAIQYAGAKVTIAPGKPFQVNLSTDSRKPIRLYVGFPKDAGEVVGMHFGPNRDVTQSALGPVTGLSKDGIYNRRENLGVHQLGVIPARSMMSGGKALLVTELGGKHWTVSLAAHRNFVSPLSPPTKPTAAPGWARFPDWLSATMLASRTGIPPPEADLSMPMTDGQARLWATFAGITGRPVKADPRWSDIAEAVSPAHPVRPIDIYGYSQWPHIWDLKVAHAGEQYDIVAVFNWADRPMSFRFTFKDLGLAAGAYLVHDFWRDTPIGAVSQGLALSVDPTSCIVFVVRPLQSHPQVMGYGAHVVNDAAGLTGVMWDANTATLRGRSAAAKPVSLALWHNGWEPVGAEGGTLHPNAVERLPFSYLSLAGPGGWSVRFRRAPAARPVSPAMSVVPGPSQVGLNWHGGPQYIVRDGELLGAVFGGHYTDRETEPNTGYQYKLFPALPDGTFGAPPITVNTHTPRFNDTWLEALPVAAPTNEWQPIAPLSGSGCRAGGKTFGHGIAVLTRSLVTYRLHRGFSRFSAKVGLSDGAQTEPVKFRVYGDEKCLFESANWKSGRPLLPFDVDVYGVNALTLTFETPTGEFPATPPIWADAKLTATPES